MFTCIGTVIGNRNEIALWVCPERRNVGVGISGANRSFNRGVGPGTLACIAQQRSSRLAVSSPRGGLNPFPYTLLRFRDFFFDHSSVSSHCWKQDRFTSLPAWMSEEVRRYGTAEQAAGSYRVRHRSPRRTSPRLFPLYASRALWGEGDAIINFFVIFIRSKASPVSNPPVFVFQDRYLFNACCQMFLGFLEIIILASS